MGGERDRQHDVDGAARRLHLGDRLGDGRHLGDDLRGDAIHVAERGDRLFLGRALFHAVVDHLRIEIQRCEYLLFGKLSQRGSQRGEELLFSHLPTPRFTYSYRDSMSDHSAKNSSMRAEPTGMMR